MEPDYYKTLGLTNTASQDEIKKAYRKLSLKHHPDRSGEKEKFQELNEAYEVLSDERKRKQYDMRSANGFNKDDLPISPDDLMGMFFNMASGGMSMPGMFPNANVHVFRNGMPTQFNMNGFNMSQALQKPTPIIKTIEITIDEAYQGCTKSIEIDRIIKDENINKMEKENVYVTIPKGIDENEIIIIREKGNVISDDNKGDVKIFIKIINNSGLLREGLNLIFNKTLSLKESLCGFTFELPYLGGKTFKINNTGGTIISHGYKKLIPNLGLERDGHKGNLIIIFSVNYPEKLSEDQISSLEKIL
jgi:DnaJ-class molecular chaperone